MAQVLIVVVLAAAAGFLVYRVSLRWSTDRSAAHGVPGSGFALEPEARPATSAQQTSTVTAQVAARVAAPPKEVPAGYLYVPLAPGRRSWQTRVFGLVGLVIVVAVTAAVLAFTLYQGGHLLNKGMKGYFETPSATPTAHVTP